MKFLVDRGKKKFQPPLHLTYLQEKRKMQKWNFSQQETKYISKRTPIATTCL